MNGEVEIVRLSLKVCILVIGLTVVQANAQTVSIVAFEDDGKAGSLSGLTDYIIEGGMDRLFEMGVICTNEKPQEGDAATFADATSGLEKAREGLVDFIVVVFIRYTRSKQKDNVLIASSFSWRVQNTKNGKTLANGTLKGLQDDMDTITKLDKVLKLVGVEIISRGIAPLIAAQ